MDNLEAPPRSVNEIVAILRMLYERSASGKRTGKYRISRRAMRSVCARRKLPEAFIGKIASELSEQGLVLVDLDSYFVVMSQNLFESYRRVTTAAVEKTLVRASE